MRREKWTPPISRLTHSRPKRSEPLAIRAEPPASAVKFPRIRTGRCGSRGPSLLSSLSTGSQLALDFLHLLSGGLLARIDWQFCFELFQSVCQVPLAFQHYSQREMINISIGSNGNRLAQTSDSVGRPPGFEANHPQVEILIGFVGIDLYGAEIILFRIG